MTRNEEQAWIRGNKAAWARIATQAERELSGTNKAHVGRRAGYAAERASVVAALRELCAEHGDNDWDDNLYLPDVIRKHLGRHLEKP